MGRFIQRTAATEIGLSLKRNPVVAILGPRQCGKTTIAKAVEKTYKNALHLDLERPSDLARLRDAETFFRVNRNRLICLDEIQRAPDLFPLLRAEVDDTGKNGRFLILGSAGPELLHQSSETLAGRIAYIELTPFMLNETGAATLQKLWLRGGFPRSFLAATSQASYQWRQDFIRTFLERDLHTLGFNQPAAQIQRFWSMCAHISGQTVNLSQIGNSLGVSHHTVKSYIDMLEGTMMLRVLRPFSANHGKRLVKAPKLYVRDSGILHALLGIETFNDLLGHPGFGASWEGFALEQILSSLPLWKSSFYRTEKGNEVDLVLEKGKRRVLVEAKATSSPQVGKGFYLSMEELESTETWIAAPVKEPYSFGHNIKVASPDFVARHLQASLPS